MSHHSEKNCVLIYTSVLVHVLVFCVKYASHTHALLFSYTPLTLIHVCVQCSMGALTIYQEFKVHVHNDPSIYGYTLMCIMYMDNLDTGQKGY